MVIQAPTPYETWVRTLRAWQSDPDEPLEGLPVMDDIFLADTGARLIKHLERASDAALNAWQDQLVEQMARAPDDFALAITITDARRVLAKRLLLGRLIALHPKVREPLWVAMSQSVRAAQQQLEYAIIRNHQAHLDNARIDTRLDVIRRHALTALLEPKFPLVAFANGELSKENKQTTNEVELANHSAVGLQKGVPAELPPGIGVAKPRTIQIKR